MIVRIRPVRLCARRVRVIRSSSGADVALALLLSMIFGMAGLVCFTLFCWKTLQDVGVLPSLPLPGGLFDRRGAWLAFAGIGWLIAQLTGAFAELANNQTQEADELPTKGLRELAAAPE